MKIIAKTLLCVVALVIATMVAGTIVSHLPLTPERPIPGAQPSLFLMLLGSLVLVVCVVPVASGLSGRFATRWLALGLMLYVVTGVNTVIELTIFGTLGGEGYLLVFYFLCFAMTAAAFASQFGSQQPAVQRPHLGTGQWLWRIGAAWLAFPLIYLVFGMCVAPFVVPHYQAGVAGLRLPPLDVIMRTQLVRSLLFLGSSLPVIRLWSGSRRRLILALGLAHTGMVGLYGLSQATFLPTVLRVLHSLEITADSFVYALVLAWLFLPRERVVVTSSVPGTIISTTTSAA